MTMRHQALVGLIAAAGAAVAVASPAAALARTHASASPAVANAPTTSTAQEVFKHLTVQQKIGQLLVVGTPATAVSSATATAITTYHAGSVILTGRSSAGVSATRAVSSALQAKATTAATGGVPLIVSTDQEGGLVQVLSGAGFSTMPTALAQGGWSTSALTASARTWGAQLAAAGVNLNLAPVADTVPSAAFAPYNIPIGYYYREFGYTPAVTGSHAAAFAAGMRAAGVMATVKHFPGLGRVTANTDTTSGVTDSTTTATDPYLGAFRTGLAGGAEVVMMSSAIYSKIDAGRPAVFSPTVVSLARSGMNLDGVIMTDDLGAAKQVAYLTPAARATSAISAGVDMVLTVDPTQAPAMVAGITDDYAASATFARTVDASVMRVLTLKQRMGLLRPNGAVRSTDVDEDGGADLVGRMADGSLRLFRTNPDGGWRPYGSGFGKGWGGLDIVLTVGDWDGDGHVDVIARRASDGVLMLYSGNGRGGILGVRQINAGWGSMTRIIAPGDWDGDGHPDLLATNAAGTMFLYRGTGRGGFLSVGAVNAGWNGIDQVTAVGSFTGNGTPALMGHVAGTTTLRLYGSNGRGGWLAPVVASTTWGPFVQVIGAGDINLDGYNDLFASDGQGSLYLAEGYDGIHVGTPQRSASIGGAAPLG